MVTLHIGKLFEDAGIGTLVVTGNETGEHLIYWEDMPVDKKGNPKEGIWIVPRGAALTRFDATHQAFDVFTRYSNKVTGSQKLEDILDYLKFAYGEVCELPIVEGYSETLYTDVQLSPTSGIENVGSDEQDKVVRVVSGEINFKKESNYGQ